VPRYFFHLCNDETRRDETGVDLTNDAAAVHHGAERARALAAESVQNGQLILDHRIEIADARGNRVGTVHFRDVVEITENQERG
jgi:hypothetical protein